MVVVCVVGFFGWLVCFVSSFKCNMIIQVGRNLGRSLVQPSAQSWVSAAF